MKRTLTKEQSNHLIELGVPKEYVTLLPSSYIDEDPEVIVTLIDLLEILPTRIHGEDRIYGGDKDYDITIYSSKYISEKDYWVTGYFDRYMLPIECKEEAELIDALYELLLWAIEEKYIKFD